MQVQEEYRTWLNHRIQQPPLQRSGMLDSFNISSKMISNDLSVPKIFCTTFICLRCRLDKDFIHFFIITVRCLKKLSGPESEFFSVQDPKKHFIKNAKTFPKKSSRLLSLFCIEVLKDFLVGLLQILNTNFQSRQVPESNVKTPRAFFFSIFERAVVVNTILFKFDDWVTAGELVALFPFVKEAGPDCFSEFFIRWRYHVSSTVQLNLGLTHRTINDICVLLKWRGLIFFLQIIN